MPSTQAAIPMTRPLYSPENIILRVLFVLFIAAGTIFYELFRLLKDRMVSGQANSEASLIALSSDESAAKSF